MQPNAHDAERRVALHRLRRAQLAEARRIRQAVAAAYTLTPAHLCAPCRAHPLVEARQMAMYLMRTRLTWPIPMGNRELPCERIGWLLSHRDHSTVLHGATVIAARLDSDRPEDASLRHRVRALGATLDAIYEDDTRTCRLTTEGNTGHRGVPAALVHLSRAGTPARS